jgi:hypothetical protein
MRACTLLQWVARTCDTHRPQILATAQTQAVQTTPRSACPAPQAAAGTHRHDALEVQVQPDAAALQSHQPALHPTVMLRLKQQRHALNVLLGHVARVARHRYGHRNPAGAQLGPGLLHLRIETRKRHIRRARRPPPPRQPRCVVSCCIRGPICGHLRRVGCGFLCHGCLLCCPQLLTRPIINKLRHNRCFLSQHLRRRSVAGLRRLALLRRCLARLLVLGAWRPARLLLGGRGGGLKTGNQPIASSSLMPARGHRGRDRGRGDGLDAVYQQRLCKWVLHGHAAPRAQARPFTCEGGIFHP